MCLCANTYTVNRCLYIYIEQFREIPLCMLAGGVREMPLHVLGGVSARVFYCRLNRVDMPLSTQIKL